MMMMVDFVNADIDIATLRTNLTSECNSLGVEVNVMAEKVFSEMHRL